MSAGFVGGVDEVGAEGIEGRGLAEDGFDSGVGEFAGESVGAEEVEVAGLGQDGEGVWGDAALGADGAGDDVAQGGACGLGAGHASEADLLLDEGVVLGAEFKGELAEAVASAVADVDDPELLLVGDDGDEGGSHSAEAEAALGAGVDGSIGGFDGLCDESGEGAGDGVVPVARAGFAAQVGFAAQAGFEDRVVPLRGVVRVGSQAVWRIVPVGEEAEDFLDGEGAGDLAGSGSAHAVADDINAVLDGVAEGVFVGGALSTPVGDGCCGVAKDGGRHGTPRTGLNQ